CPSGPAELLDEVESAGVEGVHAGRYGMLVPVGRPDLLAEGMRSMMEPDTRHRYSAAARRRLTDFHISKIADQYWTKFAAVLARHREATATHSPRTSRPARAFPAGGWRAGG